MHLQSKPQQPQLPPNWTLFVPQIGLHQQYGYHLGVGGARIGCLYYRINGTNKIIAIGRNSNALLAVGTIVERPTTFEEINFPNHWILCELMKSTGDKKEELIGKYLSQCNQQCNNQLDHSLLDTSKVHLCNLRWPFL
jgi:hypothetical protein